MPSFGYGVTGSVPNSRLVFVSFSQNKTAGAAPSGPQSAISSSGPRAGCSIRTDAPLAATMVGRGAPASQDHVLRNQDVGSTCRVSVTGPALVTETAIKRSSGSALA